MADVLFVAIVVAFLALCALYVRACERVVATADDDSAMDVAP